jgi:hypothetical protein
VRASKKLKNDELLIVQFGPTMLRKAMDDVPLWRGDHVAIKQLVDDFGRYLYLPRLQDAAVLVDAIREGLGLLTWRSETFAYADTWDELGLQYRGLRTGQAVRVTPDSGGILVRPEVAARQVEAETPPAHPIYGPGEEDPKRHTDGDVTPIETRPRVLRRFHGAVSLDPERLGRDAGKVAEEIVQHLSTQRNARVRLTLEIEVDLPEGAPDNIVRIVTENARTLKFKSQGFEES